MECIRRLVRFTAVGGAATAALFTVYAIHRAEPLPSEDFWGGLTVLAVILATWAMVEVLVRCKEEIIASQPSAAALVARTIEAIEDARAEPDAENVTRIAERHRH